ncbi:hypothetical protein D3C86_1613710 [compost metagenome]
MSLSSRCGSGEENWLDSSAMRRKAMRARLTIGKVLTRCSIGPFMYSSTSTKPLITAWSALGQNDCRASARPMTTKNNIEPRVLAITKVLIERTWVSQMKSAVPWMPLTNMRWRRGRWMRNSLAPPAMAL